jgi:hypothetical protein
VRSGVSTSQNIRPTPASSGRQGSTVKVEASGWAIMSDSSMALKPVIDEAVEPHPALEGILQLGRVDREGLELAQDVGEPEADEADLPLVDDGLDVVGGQGLIGHGALLGRACRETRIYRLAAAAASSRSHCCAHALS